MHGTLRVNSQQIRRVDVIEVTCVDYCKVDFSVLQKTFNKKHFYFSTRLQSSLCVFCHVSYF